MGGGGGVTPGDAMPSIRTSQREPSEAVMPITAPWPTAAALGATLMPCGSAPLPQGTDHCRSSTGPLSETVPAPMQLSQKTISDRVITRKLRAAVPVLALRTCS
jgi:hypothetical protein